LAAFDSFGLLSDLNISEPPEVNSIDDVLESDPLGILAADPDDIFTLKNVPKSIEMPDHIAKRQPCEDFKQFESRFKR